MKLTFAALLVLALAGCSQTPQTSTEAQPAASAASTTAPAASTAVNAAEATVPATLAKYHWQLASATDKSGQRLGSFFARPDKPLQLDFSDKGLSVSNTCNRMHGSYSVDGNKLTIGNLASTMMACADPKLMALDAAVGQYLHGSLAFTLEAAGTHPELALATAKGDTFTFAGTPTAENRFGGEGETVFLEVAPATKSCNNPGMPNAQCLYVRQLHYGKDGTRAGHPGTWHVLGQSIEGYTHEADVRNVLRVKRYQVANPPADASSVAYVLDLVVESATTK